MGQSSGIKKNFLYSSILTTAGYIFPLLTYPYVSRVLEVSNIGAVNFVDSIINYFVLFSMLGVSTSGIREIAASGKNKELRDTVFSSLLALNILTTLIALAVLIGCIYLVPELRSYKDLLWIGACKLTFNLFLIEWLYKGMEQFKFITQRTILVRCIYVVSVFIFIRKEGDRNLYYLLTTLSIIVNAIINLFYSRNFVRFYINKVNFNKYWKSFSGMGIYVILTSLYTTFNITYLGWFCGDTQVGYYTTATKIYSILLGFFTAFTGVMLPRMSSLLAEGRVDEFKNKVKTSLDCVISFSIPVIICGIFIAPQIVYWIAGPGYEGAILPMRLTIPLILIVGLEQILVLQILIPLKEDKAIIRNSFFGALVAIILNMILVERLQSIGSAFVWMLCECVILLLSYKTVRQSIKLKFPFAISIRMLGLGVPLGITLWMMRYILADSRILYPLVAVAISFAYLLYTNISLLKNPVACLIWDSVIAKISKMFRV